MELRTEFNFWVLGSNTKIFELFANFVEEFKKYENRLFGIVSTTLSSYI
jgi:hypothetical protein